MKKILGVMILGLFWCNVVFADLILFCKQEVRLIIEKDNSETINMKQDWKFVITETEIIVPGFEVMYKELMRKNYSETSYYASDKMVADESFIAFHTYIKISRTTGEGYISQTIANTTTKQPFICSTKEPKLLF
ncbi:hypothetical protein ABXT63_04305 [Candidatus Pelagibacter sp. Uisw_092]|jgi:hypothetical protein|uniref:hypothetical protein n=1 Tax=Candidatus Pelagibacter sp. Uisw_092 TaxID=3230979 RepID=UPI0039E8DC97|tara:strand:- start:525 stop:926 length:402 start_codon:yes stop_codon:yes gene_type:complete